MIYFCPQYGAWREYYRPCYYCLQVNYHAGRKDLTIIDEWNAVSAPPPPELQSTSVDPKTSALLVLDMETSICNNPRCIATISKINQLLVRSRERGMLIVYSLTRTGNITTIAPQIAPLPSDPVVKSSVDKFYKTDLDQILHEHGIKTVLITGYAANGAVLHTATSAAFRGYNVIIPVDGMSALNPYAEQYTAWHMLNSPGTRNQAILTKINLIHFSHPYR